MNVVNTILNILFDSSSLGLSGEALEFLVINEGCCPVTVYESREAVERMDRGDGSSCGHLQALKGAAASKGDFCYLKGKQELQLHRR